MKLCKQCHIPLLKRTGRGSKVYVFCSEHCSCEYFRLIGIEKRRLAKPDCRLCKRQLTGQRQFYCADCVENNAELSSYFRMCRRKWYERHRDKILRVQRARYLKKRDAIRAQQRTYRALNIDHKHEQFANWLRRLGIGLKDVKFCGFNLELFQRLKNAQAKLKKSIQKAS